MRKSVVVLAIVLGLGGGVSDSKPPPDGFSCDYTNQAESTAKEASSRSPQGGPQRGEDSAENAQFTFCNTYGST